jgi:Predicted acetyltransferase
MKGVFLAEPDKKYQKSFENYALAYKNINDDEYFNKYKKALENFDGYLKKLNRYRNGIDLPEGYVAVSTFWLIADDEVVGVTRVRHQEVECAGHIGYDISPCYRNKGYGTRILELALQKAGEIGITEAIVTCSVENTASKKIIEKNNGELLGTVYDEEDDENLYKYKISINSNQP